MMCRQHRDKPERHFQRLHKIYSNESKRPAEGQPNRPVIELVPVELRDRAAARVEIRGGLLTAERAYVRAQ